MISIFLHKSIAKCDLMVSCSMYLSYIMNQIELIKPVSQKDPYKCAYSFLLFNIQRASLLSFFTESFP